MLRSLGTMVLLLAIFGYFSFHLMNGPRSIFAQAQILETHDDLQAELSQAQASNAQLRSDLAGLRPETLDEDLLIERLHSMSLTLPGELLLYTVD